LSTIGNQLGVNQRTVFRFVATAGQTSLVGIDANGLILSYVRNLIDVHVNGLMLTQNIDFTGSDGSAIVLNQALNAGDEVYVIAQAPFSVADT
jgi:hypothetical protein